MRYAEKLYQQMLLKRFNQQRLAQASGVSDSEVSRILNGKSQPGMENAFKLARALGISLDYLADDALDADPSRPSDPISAEEREILDAAKALGHRQARRVLETAGDLGFEVAIRRLLGAEMKPLVEVGEAGRPAAAPAPAPPVQSQAPNRASSA